MAKLDYTREDLTRVVCNAFKTFLRSNTDEEARGETQVAIFLEGLLDPYLESGCGIHCMVSTEKLLIVDLKLTKIDQERVELFSDICRFINDDEKCPDVAFGVYLQVDGN